MTDPEAPAEDGVVDLGAVGRACATVVSWYDDLTAGRDPSITRLDLGLVQLAALPPVGGRLGRAIALVARGGATESDATVAALELLRHAATCAVANEPAPVPARRPARRTARIDVPLPGLGAAADEGGEPEHAGASGAHR